MMHECPKCGFTQPKDRYCANCGIDIDNYKPASTPLLKQLAKNTSLQITLAVLIVSLMGGFIYMTQTQHLDSQDSAYSQAQLSQEIQNQTAAANQGPTEASGFSPSAESGQAITDENNATEATASTIQKRTETEGASTIPRQISLSFAEITRPMVLKILSENEVLSESAQTRIVLVQSKTADEKYNDRDNVLRLPGNEIMALTQNGATEFDYMSLSPNGGEEVGMNISLQPKRVTADMIELELNAVLLLKNKEGSSLITTDVETTFSFSPQHSILVLGVIPNQPSFADDLILFNATPLSILKSPQFQNRMTEFAIFISVK